LQILWFSAFFLFFSSMISASMVLGASPCHGIGLPLHPDLQQKLSMQASRYTHQHTVRSWWSRWTSVFTASFILFCLVLPFQVFLSPCSSVLIWKSFASRKSFRVLTLFWLS
jgi:hypothetical protein